jgi:hypothetical protein
MRHMPNQFTTACRTCHGLTSKAYARAHDGQCKSCAEPTDSQGQKIASANEQHARYIDCGPAAWDDR